MVGRAEKEKLDNQILMNKKAIFTFLAFLAMAAAIYGVVKWQENEAERPTRQQQEIR